MLISHKHKFVFIHFPKTAGTSITSALEPYCDKPEDILFNRMLSTVGINVNWFIGPSSWRRGRKHSSASQVKIMLPENTFNEYFKFAYVRNPWALLVSYYHFIKGDKAAKRSSRINNMSGFDEYLLYEIKRNKFSQSKFLVDSEGSLLVDYVGRFENLVQDYETICSRIGIPSDIPHKKKSTHQDYRSYYNDDTAQLVADHWAEDIRRFNYSFDEPSSPTRPTTILSTPNAITL